MAALSAITPLPVHPQASPFINLFLQQLDQHIRVSPSFQKDGLSNELREEVGSLNYPEVWETSKVAYVALSSFRRSAAICLHSHGWTPESIASSSLIAVINNALKGLAVDPFTTPYASHVELGSLKSPREDRKDGAFILEKFLSDLPHLGSTLHIPHSTTLGMSDDSEDGDS